MTRTWLDRTPCRRESPWDYRSEFWIVNSCLDVLWLLRMLSPAAWILAQFRVERADGQVHVSARSTEVYVLLTNSCFVIALVFAPLDLVRTWTFSVIVIVFILESTQYHVYLMILRPEIDKSYAHYSFSRTIILTLLSYQGLITLFGLLYLSRFPDSFSISPTTAELSRTSSWALSAGILTGTGFSGIAPKVASAASVVAGIESITGILFLTTILGLAISRASTMRRQVGIGKD
jgi:hypothetical protein